VRKGKFAITSKEFLLAVTLAVMGFLFSSREWILYLNSLNPIQGLVIYYIILYSSLTILSKMGLVVFNIKIQNPVQTFGLLLITFAFFIIVDWESQYVQLITKGNIEQASNVFYQAEDGATWYFWTNVVGVKDVETARWLTFVITPFILTLIGAFLVTRVELGGW
jgi:hypothetical protein